MPCEFFHHISSFIIDVFDCAELYVIGAHVCFQTLTSAVKKLTLVTQPPHVPTLRGHMSAPATLVTMEMEETV